MTEKNETMKLWDSFEKTDPKYTKAFTRGGGFKGTAINGTYIVKKLTEQFGPCGTGWRFVLEDEQIVEGHTLKNGDKAKLHIVRGHLDYRQPFAGAFKVDDPWFSTSPQFGQTMLVDENKNGVFMDEEAPKKSITDCISKCAVLLGIAADIHLGLFDDNKYVNERKAEEAQKAAPTSPAEADKEAAKNHARIAYASIKDQAAQCETVAELDALIVGSKNNLADIKSYSEAAWSTLDKILAQARDRIQLNDPLP